MYIYITLTSIAFIKKNQRFLLHPTVQRQALAILIRLKILNFLQIKSKLISVFQESWLFNKLHDQMV